MLIAVLSSLVPSIPTVIVEVTMLAIAVSRWNKHPRVSMLVASSAVLLLMLDLLVRAAYVILPMKMQESGRTIADMGIFYVVLGGASGLLHAIALGLLIAAVFSERGSLNPPRGLASVSER